MKLALFVLCFRSVASYAASVMHSCTSAFIPVTLPGQFVAAIIAYTAAPDVSKTPASSFIDTFFRSCRCSPKLIMKRSKNRHFWGVV